MSYIEAKSKYAAFGVDADRAIAALRAIPVSLHCWQGDDVRGFDTDPSAPLTGGIQTTGNYPENSTQGAKCLGSSASRPAHSPSSKVA